MDAFLDCFHINLFCVCVCVWNSMKLLHTWGCTEIVPQSSCLRGFGSLNPNSHFRKTQWVSDLATSLCIASTVVWVPLHTTAKTARTLFNVWWSTFKLSVVQLCFITEIIPKSLFLLPMSHPSEDAQMARRQQNRAVQDLAVGRKILDRASKSVT